MPNDTWSAFEQYAADLLIGRDTALEQALERSHAAGLPQIQVTPAEGKLLHLLARVYGARRILEVGTLGGYSTIWLARAVAPAGRVISLEVDPRHAEVARNNIASAGLGDIVDIRLGKALDTLPRLQAERRGPFDLTFIDADKENNPAYFRWALTLSRPGSLIIVDNVVREGRVLDASSTDASVQGVRRMISMIAEEPRVSATIIQTVGTKGYDGFAVALVTDGMEGTGTA